MRRHRWQCYVNKGICRQVRRKSNVHVYTKKSKVDAIGLFRSRRRHDCRTFVHRFAWVKRKDGYYTRAKTAFPSGRDGDGFGEQSCSKWLWTRLLRHRYSIEPFNRIELFSLCYSLGFRNFFVQCSKRLFWWIRKVNNAWQPTHLIHEYLKFTLWSK